MARRLCNKLVSRKLSTISNKGEIAMINDYEATSPITSTEINNGTENFSNSDIASTLNELIETSKDGEKELTRAAEDAREPDLVRAFSDAEEANRTASAELQDQVRLLGGTAEQDGSLKAAARRSWTSVKAMVSSRDDSAIMEECERAMLAVLANSVGRSFGVSPASAASVMPRNRAPSQRKM